MTGRNILCMAFMDALLIFLLFPQILYELWDMPVMALRRT